MKCIDELAEIDKPREKLQKRGVKSLKDYELMALLLGSGVKGKDVLKLSREILKKFESDFDELDLEKLLDIHGLGTAKASQIVASIELSKRYLIKQNPKITCAKDVVEELKAYRDKRQEYFLAIYLDGANYICHHQVITIGTLNESLVHPREVFAPAVEHRCASVIVAHNHPSGSLNPSSADIQITRRLKESGKLLGIELIDHIILTKESYVSFDELEML